MTNLSKEDIIHILPTNDDVDYYNEEFENYDKESGHITAEYCVCKPELIELEDGLICVHNALDGRHIKEEAEEIINAKESFQSYIERIK